MKSKKSIKTKNQRRKVTSKKVPSKHREFKIITIIYENWKIILGACLIILIVYFPIVNNDFLEFDDSKFIYNNPLIIDFSSLKDLFTRQLYTPHYKPLVYCSWKIEYLLFGPNPDIFHLNNLLLHLLSSILVFLVSSRLFQNFYIKKESRRLAIAATVIFALHPMKVESVAWAVERKDVLFGFFFLCSMLCYLKYISEKGHYKFLLISSLFYLFSILSKAPGVTLIAILFLIDILLNRQLNFQLIREKLPYLGVFIVALFLFGIFYRPETFLSGMVEGILEERAEIQYPLNMVDLPNFYRRFLIINYRFWGWIAHWLLPIKLSIIYPRYSMLKLVGSFIHIIPVISIGLLVFVYSIRKRRKLMFFGIMFFCVTISPALAFAETGTNFLSDRYTYIPSIGIATFLIIVLKTFFDKYVTVGLRWPLIIALLFIMSITTFSRILVWKNSTTLFSDAIEKFPQNPFALLNRGIAHRQERNMQAAVKDYTDLLSFTENAKAYLNRGNIYFEQGKYDLANKDYNMALEISPKYVKAYSSRGAMLASRGEYQKALDDLNEALRLSPKFRDALMNRAKLFYVSGNMDRAISDLNKYISMFGRNDEINQLEKEIKR